MSKLVLVRHGQSAWNEKTCFTGWKDPDLTDKGHQEAITAGQSLKAKALVFDIAFTSALQRAQNTCALILENMDQADLSTTRNQALNERDYGDLSGLNKDDARAKWGEDQVHIWRRSFDVPSPGGEPERYSRTGAAYYEAEIVPHLLAGKLCLWPHTATHCALWSWRLRVYRLKKSSR